jgi:3-oxoacyl-[acyl-carrier protein] reductase
MDLGIAGKTALVTASSKGLGRATALALAAEGVNVVISARGQNALQATAKDIEALGKGNVHHVVADVTDPAVPQQLVQAAVETFGGCDILVANAGGPPTMRALDVSDDDIAKAINANLTTSVRLVEAAVPHMKNTQWGRVCLITSSSIKEPIPSLALSNMARTGLWSWAKAAAGDVAEDGITINSICPGAHATDRMKELGMQGRMGSPADFGKAAAFLCSDQAKFINGTTLVVDGGEAHGL